MPQSQPEVVSQDAPVTFSSRVNLVSVPVVVRDRKGRAVGHLKREDFQLFDKGKVQVISKFTVETAEAPPPETQADPIDPAGVSRRRPSFDNPGLPERYVAYLFDDIHLKPGDLLQTRQAVNRHLDESLEPSARAAVFTTSGQVLAEFTADRETLHAAVNRVLPYTGGGPDPQHDCPAITYSVADLLMNQLLYLDGALFSDKQLLGMLQSGQADTALAAVYSEASQCNGACMSGQTDTLTGQDTCQVQALINVKAAARRALTYGDQETAASLGALRDIVRKLSAMPGSRNLVLVSPGFLLTRDHRSGEYDLLDRAIRANVTVNTIDMRGLFTTVPGGDASQPSYRSALAMRVMGEYERRAATEADDVLAELADGTGGTFFHNDNRLKEGLNHLAARPEYVYVLAFSPQDLKFDGSYHALKVALRESSGLTLQARRGYWAPKRAVDPAQAAHEEMLDAVFSRDEIRDIPVDLQTEFFKSSEEKAELTVLVRLRADSVHFRKAGDRNNDTLTVVAGLFDSNGNYISGIERVLEMHLRDQTLAGLQNSGIAVKQNFSVAPGRYVVRLVVRDAEGHAMAARNAGVEIP